jgi:hypothetical protein
MRNAARGGQAKGEPSFKIESDTIVEGLIRERLMAHCDPSRMRREAIVTYRFVPVRTV